MVIRQEVYQLWVVVPGRCKHMLHNDLGTVRHSGACEGRGCKHLEAPCRYARAGALVLTGNLTGNAALDGLVRTLHDWTKRLDLPRLSDFGVTDHDIPAIVANSRGSSMTTNPVHLRDDEIAELVKRRL